MLGGGTGLGTYNIWRVSVWQVIKTKKLFLGFKNRLPLYSYLFITVVIIIYYTYVFIIVVIHQSS